MMNNTVTLSDAMLEATFDAKHTLPIHVAMGLEEVAARIVGIRTYMYGKREAEPIMQWHPERARKAVDEAREMLTICDRLVGRGNNINRRELDARIAQLDRHADLTVEEWTGRRG